MEGSNQILTCAHVMFKLCIHIFRKTDNHSVMWSVSSLQLVALIREDNAFVALIGEDDAFVCTVVQCKWGKYNEE